MTAFFTFPPIEIMEFCILGTSKVISGWVATCDSGHAWRLYITIPLGNQAVTIMSKYLTQSKYADSDLSSPCHVIIMPSIRLVKVIEMIENICLIVMLLNNTPRFY